MSFNVVFASFKADPSVSYLQRILLKDPVGGLLSDFALQVYKDSVCVESIHLDFNVRIKSFKKTSLYFHYDPEQQKAAVLFSEKPQLIINFCPQHPKLSPEDVLTLKLSRIKAAEFLKV